MLRWPFHTLVYLLGSRSTSKSALNLIFCFSYSSEVSFRLFIIIEFEVSKCESNWGGNSPYWLACSRESRPEGPTGQLTWGRGRSLFFFLLFYIFPVLLSLFLSAFQGLCHHSSPSMCSSGIVLCQWIYCIAGFVSFWVPWRLIGAFWVEKILYGVKEEIWKRGEVRKASLDGYTKGKLASAIGCWPRKGAFDHCRWGRAFS